MKCEARNRAEHRTSKKLNERNLTMKKIKGGVTAPKGFAAMGLKAGIKKDKKDMAMIYSSTPCVAAGTFTTNQVKAAPVKWDQKMIYGEHMHLLKNAAAISIILLSVWTLTSLYTSPARFTGKTKKVIPRQNLQP